jgi:hypothetical protein
MPLQDVQVTIDVQYPAPRIGLGVPLILTQVAGAATYEEYLSLAALEADYANTTDTYEKAAAIFNQPNRPEKVAVATYDTGGIATTLDDFYNRAWHFALVANDLQADQVAAANFIAAKEFKLVAVQVSGDVARTALAGLKRTIIFDHDVAGEHLDAAAVGNLGSLPVGSITWKFKELSGITPRYLNSDELTEIDADSANAYVVKAGQAQLSEGVLANGEYIDLIHGQDFVKADMENEIQYALQNSPKAPYDQRGINLIGAAATTTLKRAFTNGIIGLNADGLPDYAITTLSREQSDPQDRADRTYRGLSFEFGLAGAIHEVRVQGAIKI